MIQIKKTILTLVALLAVTTGAWADELASSYSSDATLNNVTVSDNMEVTIATGVTVTINNGLNITSGTLTVTGPGTLVVNGAKGNDGNSDFDGGPGGTGGVAISGNIIVQGGATVTATGGTGGNGGNGEWDAGNGGNGGVAFAGTLTYKSGTVTAIGGSAGSGGWSDDEERYASSGSAGKAFANDVDFTQTTGYSVTNGTSTIGSVLNQTKVVISGGTEPAAPTGPKVAWNKAEKTGTFKMPGGNVTLEPEYFPQAALTAAPTAINDVPATTDGAIVKAGTVANIGTTETAQGTVMYYVSPTALDDAALLALAADKWTADVPTAEKLAQGQAYVYYYVRGNDSDTDEENFSDGDILSANALQVTLGAAPLWNAEFDLTDAPEADKAGKWSTNIPEGGVTKGQTVTVTYTGSKKVIGVKAEKKAAAVPVTAITLNKTETTIYKVNGTATETLSVTAVTPDEATDKTYTWSSDATGVATVDENGVVTAVAVGTAHIRATANDGSGVYGECTVTVSDLSAYYSKMKECGCGDLTDKCANDFYPNSPFTGQVLSADQAIALAKAKAAETSSNCAVFYDNSGDFGGIKFAKNDGTTGSAFFEDSASEKGLSGYKGFYVSK